MKEHSSKLLAFSLLLVAIVSAALAQTKWETPISQLPFANLAVHHDMDSRCPPNGSSDGNVYHYAQNAAKNNFNSKGTPVALTLEDFSRLQAASQKKIDAGEIVLKGKYPEDRARLMNLIDVRGNMIGEGTLVTLDAYVFRAQYANTKFNKDSNNRPGKGEAVNCDSPELDWNVIHIALSDKSSPTTDECTTVTAELSPHYRPAIWDRFHDGLNADVEAIVPGVLQHKVILDQKKGDQPVYVRLTGPLFYDASHTPCKFDGQKIIERHGPERRSIWEIHPVYRIQIRNQRKQWMDLDQWAKK
jgi:hypothetical protein